MACYLSRERGEAHHMRVLAALMAYGFTFMITYARGCPVSDDISRRTQLALAASTI